MRSPAAGRLGRRRAIDHQAEAVVAQPRRQVLGARDARDHRADLGQHAVARGIAVEPVDLAHAGDVEARHRERGLRAQVLRDQVLDIAVQEAMAEQAGETIGGRRRLGCPRGSRAGGGAGAAGGPSPGRAGAAPPAGRAGTARPRRPSGTAASDRERHPAGRSAAPADRTGRCRSGSPRTAAAGRRGRGCR